MYSVLYAGCADGTTLVCNAATGAVLQRLTGHCNAVSSLVYSRNPLFST